MKCKLCGEEVKGKKKGYCLDCRVRIPYKSSNRGQPPFSRIEEHNRLVRSKK